VNGKAAIVRCRGEVKTGSWITFVRPEEGRKNQNPCRERKGRGPRVGDVCRQTIGGVERNNLKTGGKGTEWLNKGLGGSKKKLRTRFPGRRWGIGPYERNMRLGQEKGKFWGGQGKKKSCGGTSRGKRTTRLDADEKTKKRGSQSGLLNDKSRRAGRLTAMQERPGEGDRSD